MSVHAHLVSKASSVISSKSPSPAALTTQSRSSSYVRNHRRYYEIVL